MSIAASQNREGKTDLAQFICNRGGKAVDECLAVAHELPTAEAKFAAQRKLASNFCTTTIQGNA